MTHITIYTDASFVDGLAGIAALLITFRPDGKIDHSKIVTGHGGYSSSSHAEIAAVEFGVRMIRPQHADLTIYSDSQSLIHIMTGIATPKRNVSAFNRLSRLCEPHQINWQWVRAHDGNPYNERVNFEARKTLSRYFKRLGIEDG